MSTIIIFLLVLSIVGVVVTTQQEDKKCSTDRCTFNGGILSCREPEEWPLSSEYPPECAESVVTLEIINGRFDDFRLAPMIFLPALEAISITKSNLELVRSLPVPQQLVRLDLSGNELVAIDWSLLKRMGRLSHLNLADNKLSFIEPLTRDSLPNLVSLDLSGNDWECSVDFQWALELHEASVLVNGENLTCQDESKKHDSWFKWNYSVIKREINKRIVNAECRERTLGCECEFASEGKEGRGSYSVQVDCSYRNLTTLPESLPSFTKELDVTGNWLTSLDEVSNYDDLPLKILIADWNRIHSIRNLSGSVFLRNFSRFSLQHNQLSPHEIPLDEITKLPSDFEVKYLYLYNNSWECDCHTATVVREWLWKNRHTVNDSSLILCSLYDKKLPVLHLLPNVVCADWDDGTSRAEAELYRLHLLYVLIAAETVLILGIALKFSYDSWRYLRHGELPWIATKLF